MPRTKAVTLSSAADVLRASGWACSPHTHTPLQQSGFWVYSINAVHGLRVSAQVSPDRLQEAEANSSNQPGHDRRYRLEDMLDYHDGMERTSDFAREGLCSAALNFVRSSSHWRSKPVPPDGSGEHLVVIDWLSAAGRWVILPIWAVGQSQISESALAGLVAPAVDQYVLMFPVDQPVR